MEELYKLNDKDKKAILVGFFSNNFSNKKNSFSVEYTMSELAELAKAAGCVVETTIIQNKAKVEVATYIGKGKVEEVRLAAENLSADVIIFNEELSGSQIRNLEDAIGVDVVDRTMLILDIFANRATSNIAKMQIELALNQYRLPRLTGLRDDLSRTGSGIGARGPGEQQLELDKRKIRKRISDLQNKLKESDEQKALTRKQRKKMGVPIVALVGYTNAGKSTIMNYFVDKYSDSEEHKQVFAKDMLFATLDTYHRRIELGDNKGIILVDTIGFVSNLPHNLVAAFKATLEEVLEADLLLHIVDGSNENAQHQVEITQQTLKQIGAVDKPILEVYNKSDRENFTSPAGCLKLSAKKELGFSELIKEIEKFVFKDVELVEMLVPYTAGAALNTLMNIGAVKTVEHLAEGTYLMIELKRKDIAKYSVFLKDGDNV